MPKRHSQDTRETALELWLKGHSLKDIAQALDVQYVTIKKWHERYNWAKVSKETKEKAVGKLSEKVSKDSAFKDFNVREEFIGLFEHAKGLTTDDEGLIKIQANKAANQVLFNIAKIDGLITDKKKIDGDLELKVKPILGNFKIDEESE